MLDFVVGLPANIEGINKPWGKLSDFVEVRLPHTAFFETYFENILSIMVC